MLFIATGHSIFSTCSRMFCYVNLIKGQSPRVLFSLSDYVILMTLNAELC